MMWPFRAARVALPTAQAARLAALKALPSTSLRSPLNGMRWVVVDLETGGFDPVNDPLLSIGAVEIVNGRLCLGTGFEVRLQQATATSHDNILVHGLTHSQQRSGKAAAEALLEFAEFAAGAPLVAFNVPFDRTVLQRAMREMLGWALPQLWLDAATIGPLLFLDRARECRTLDDWLSTMSIHNFARHSALADAAATSQLWLILMQAAARQGYRTVRDLEKLRRSRAWLGG